MLGLEELWRRSTAVLNTYVFLFCDTCYKCFVIKNSSMLGSESWPECFFPDLMEMHIMMIYNYMSCLLEDTGRYYYTCYQVKTFKKNK